MADTPVIDVAQIIDEQRMGPFHWKVVVLSFLIMLVDGYDIVAIAYVAPLLREQWGFAAAALGPLFGAGLIGGLFGPPIFGYLADRFGRKPTILWGSVWFGLFTLLQVWAPSLGPMMALRFIAGIGIGGVLPIGTALVTEFAPRRIRATMIVMGVVGVALGGGLAGLVAALFMSIYGWQIVFWTGGIVPLAFAFVGIFVFPESIKFLTLKLERRAELVKLLAKLKPGFIAPADARFLISDEVNRPQFSFKALFTGPLAVITPLYWVTNFINLLVFFFVNQWTPALLASTGVSVQRAALATAAFQLLGFLGALAIMRPVDRYGFLPVPVLFAIGIPVIAAIGLPGIPDTGIIALAGVAGFCIIGIQFGVISTESQVYPTYIRSWGIGSCYALGRAGSVIGPVAAGILVGMNFSVQSLFYAAGLSMIVGLIVSIILAPLYRKQLDDMHAIAVAAPRIAQASAGSQA